MFFVFPLESDAQRVSARRTSFQTIRGFVEMMTVLHAKGTKLVLVEH